MRSVVVSLLLTLRASLRDRAALQLEILAFTPSAQRCEPIAAAATTAHACGPNALGLAIESLERMAGSRRDRQARLNGKQKSP